VRRVATLVLLALAAAAPSQEESWTARGRQGACAAGSGEAAAAAIELLRAGGNAMDAAVASVLCLSVTDSSQFCFGGEVPFIVWDAAKGRAEVVAGLGAAPKLATPEFFAARGGIPSSGILTPVVPGALDACLTVLQRYGKKRFSDCAAPMLRALDADPGGWRGDLARTVRRLCEAEAKGGLRAVADAFYRGFVADEIDAWARREGALIRKEDLAAHVTPVELPVGTDYRGHRVLKCGPWTQGPWLLEALNLLEGFDLRAAGRGSAEALHLELEAMKLGLADRDAFYADPGFAEVPLETLTAKDYAALRRPLIDPARASLEWRPGDPRGKRALLAEPERRRGFGSPGNDTSTCVVADADGNVVAATPSGWSGVLAGRTGVWLGSRLQSFNLWEGHPNRLAPGKRPRITLTPTLVLREGAPVLAVSVAGGDAQDQVALQLVLDRVDFGLSPEASVRAPRILTDHYVGSFGQSAPRLGSAILQDEISAGVARALSAKGHLVARRPAPLWWPVVLGRDAKTGEWVAAGDPAARRRAAAY
jgi:gamma-glutamyltranspeptidase/glutathione hydrolase